MIIKINRWVAIGWLLRLRGLESKLPHFYGRDIWKNSLTQFNDAVNHDFVSCNLTAATQRRPFRAVTTSVVEPSKMLLPSAVWRSVLSENRSPIRRIADVGGRNASLSIGVCSVSQSAAVPPQRTSCSSRDVKSETLLCRIAAGAGFARSRWREVQTYRTRSEVGRCALFVGDSILW